MYRITNSVNLNLVDSRDFMNATTLLREQYENDGISNQAIDIALEFFKTDWSGLLGPFDDIASMSPNLDSQHNKDRVAALSYFKSHHFDVIRYLVQALSVRIVVDTMKQRFYVSKCCSMIAWSIHEFFKILKIDFDEVYEELRLCRSFVADVVTPRETPRINLQCFHSLGFLLRDYCSITRFYNDINYEKCLISYLKLR